MVIFVLAFLRWKLVGQWSRKLKFIVFAHRTIITVIPFDIAATMKCEFSCMQKTRMPIVFTKETFWLNWIFKIRTRSHVLICYCRYSKIIIASRMNSSTWRENKTYEGLVGLVFLHPGEKLLTVWRPPSWIGPAYRNANVGTERRLWQFLSSIFFSFDIDWVRSLKKR